MKIPKVEFTITNIFTNPTINASLNYDTVTNTLASKYSFNLNVYTIVITFFFLYLADTRLLLQNITLNIPFINQKSTVGIDIVTHASAFTLAFSLKVNIDIFCVEHVNILKIMSNSVYKPPGPKFVSITTHNPSDPNFIR